MHWMGGSGTFFDVERFDEIFLNFFRAFDQIGGRMRELGQDVEWWRDWIVGMGCPISDDLIDSM